MATDWNKLATDVIELVGGEENITSITHCVTRLRFMLKDEAKADDEKIDKLDGVIQVMHASGQYQVVIGAKVGEAYDAVVAQLPNLVAGEVADDDAADEGKEKGKGGFSLNSLFDIVSGIFVPFIGIFYRSRSCPRSRDHGGYARLAQCGELHVHHSQRHR